MVSSLTTHAVRRAFIAHTSNVAAWNTGTPHTEEQRLASGDAFDEWLNGESLNLLVSQIMEHRQMGSAPKCVCGWAAPLSLNDTKRDRRQWVWHLVEAL